MNHLDHLNREASPGTTSPLIGLRLASEAATLPGEDTEDAPVFEELLMAAALRLTATLAQARDLGAVEGAFARLLGSAPVRQARFLEPVSLPAAAARAAFRRGLEQLYEEARAWNHALNKPYGYAGDFAVLELIYDRVAHQDTRAPWAALADVWATGTQLPRAVAARKEVLRSWLERHIDERPGRPPLKLLSIACGAAREVRELGMAHLQRTELTLLDADVRALSFAAARLRSLPQPLDIEFVIGDSIRGTNLEPVRARAPFDVIYSFGLFDHLPDTLVVRVMKRYAAMLDRRGRFLFCLKDRRHYDAFFYDWFYDWRFIARTADDGPILAARAGLAITDVLTVEGGAVHVFVCAPA
jgi:SAM-dependent methyltransferase